MVKLPFRSPVRRRSLVTGGALVAVLILVVFAVPFPYARTVGHEYDLQLASPAGRAQWSALAGGLQHAFPNLSLNLQQNGDALLLSVRGAVLNEPMLRSAARAAGLEVRDLRSRPWREPARGSLFAQIAARVYRVDITDLRQATPEQIEAEVRRQLEAQGAEGVDVHVQKDGTQTLIEAHVQSPDAGGGDVQIESPRGQVQHYRFDALQGSTPEEKAAALQRKLDAQGIPVRVVWRDGRLQVEKR